MALHTEDSLSIASEPLMAYKGFSKRSRNDRLLESDLTEKKNLRSDETALAS